MLVYILFAVLFPLTLFYVLLILTCIRGWTRMKTVSIKEGLHKKVSVLVPVRNEGNHIAETLEGLLDQNYPKENIEIIVLDDFSNDSTLEEIRKLTDERLRVISLKDHLSAERVNQPNKKQAISIGVQEAKGEIIVTTDGDCHHSKNWVRSLVSSFNTEKSFITGPVILKGSGFMRWFQLLDNLALNGITAASIQMNRPFMSNGANMAFSKANFEDLGGYEGIDNIATGDDLLLMQKFHANNQKSVGYALHPETVVSTQLAPTFKEFVQQRVRWLSKASSFSDGISSVVLIMAYCFCLGIVGSLLLLPFYPALYPIVLGGILAKLFFDFLFMISIRSFYKPYLNGALLWMAPLASFLHIFYVIGIGFASQFFAYEWKGRKVGRRGRQV